MRKRRFGFHCSAGAPLFLAVLVFFLNWRLLGALLLSAVVHEAGHLAVLLMLGAELTGLRAENTGLIIETNENMGAAGKVVSASAGPLLGGVFSVLCGMAGAEWGLTFLTLCSGTSAALTIFNILPALPLDGGRVIEAAAGRRTVLLLGFVTAMWALGAGLLLIAEGKGWGVFIMGVWLLWEQAGL